jgi:hypothetical protein
MVLPNALFGDEDQFSSLPEPCQSQRTNEICFSSLYSHALVQQFQTSCSVEQMARGNKSTRVLVTSPFIFVAHCDQQGHAQLIPSCEARLALTQGMKHDLW